MKKEIKICESVEEIAELLVHQIQMLTNTEPEKEFISIALSGGSTPKAIYQYLSTQCKAAVDWSQILWFWGDERCVPPSDDQSNFKLALDYLIRPLGIPESKVYRIRGENNPEEETHRYSDQVGSILPLVSGIPQFDLIWLGIGEDGHTASIFPNNIDLFYSENLFESSRHPATNQHRITATGKLINQARIVVIIAMGDQKAKRVAQIIDHGIGHEDLPASLVSPSNGTLFWLLDAPAASKISFF